METIEKRGRFYCILRNNRVLGRRRSEGRAFLLLTSLYFKPIQKLSHQVRESSTGAIGRVSGFSWFDGGENG